ncbi:electron-transferring-flavoprotein dehydrogenase [Halarchaeum rubridurum]|uniref:Electron transfer flavoprotein n=1 Tax=Halarchaeum rubridurum TaxID=489911 RepID=A0A830G3P2_9EURY|nr:NAD(P)/FAD-dependent oxidoreductase [Halarchaeum rubridurum]MBP1955489.1 electron-transferring-flavoprotein dehydrogenase [Halarchaeum rubridurum]GGM72754.1 electron transfer flavoprotein [Halarchaeum rubridurum]
MNHVDVAVVGGGPAGTSAAERAAAEGASTVVFESGVPRADRDRLGPDSTDAAGFLDYWVDIADIDVDELPEGVVQCELDDAEFIGPEESVSVDRTGIESSYDGFGFTFQRAKLDDWLRERAEDAGADYRVGDSVTDVETDLSDGHEHTLTLSNGEEWTAEYVILADGPQRRVTIPVLDRFLPADESASERLSPPKTNHIAYQEYRKFPEGVLDSRSIKFWWGWMPGETAYPWVFPNADDVARVGLTMPIGMDMEGIDASDYRLLREDDESIPNGSEYIRRLLEDLYGDEYDVESDFPVVEEGYGKSKGTETYSISSTRPIDSPTAAGIAVVGGAMGTTSAFHEGGDHVAIRTGKLAGELAALDRLEAYNDAWKDAIGDEILRNVAIADVVEEYGPDDWDTAFRVCRQMLESADSGKIVTRKNASVGLDGIRLYKNYKSAKFRYRKGKYTQLREAEYRY